MDFPEKNHYLLPHADILYMASFRFTEDFESLINELIEKTGHTKTSLIVEAVTTYARSQMPDDVLRDHLRQLEEEHAYIRKEIDEIKTLVTQVIKNQHRFV